MDSFLQQHLQQQIANAAKQLEEQVDTQLHELGKLDPDDLEQIREKRLQDLKRQAQKRRQWLAQGHGEYREIPSEKDFFAEMKGEERVVCHFYRDSWPCQVMDKHMQLLASSHLETKFIKINAEKSPFLTDRLKIWMLPTLALIKQENTVDYVVGFSDLGDKDDFDTETLAMRLQAGGLLFNNDRPAKGVATSSAVRTGRPNSWAGLQADESSDFSE